MPAYRELQPGLYELDTPQGPLAVTATEDELRAEGHFPDSLSIHKTGATAQNAINLSGGPRQSFTGPEVASDAPPPPQSVPQLTTGLGGHFKMDNGGPKEAIPGLANALATGAPPRANLEELDRLGRPRPISSEEREEQKRLRGGGEVKQIGGGGHGAPRPTGGGGGGGGRSGGRDVRVGFSVQKSGLRPEDIEAAELAEADASIERKMGAQNIADRRLTQTEALSAEMGRQIQREGVALRQMEERNKAQREDYEQRQAAIERERDEVAKLNVSPAELVEEGGLTGIIAALTILAAAPAAAYNGGRNLAKEAIQENLDRKLAKAKDKVAGKETDFERMVKIYGSPAEAEAEFRDRQRLFVQQMGQKMATDAGALDAADALRMQFADWDDERAQSRLARQEALAGRVTEQWAYQPFGGGGRPAVSEADVQKLASKREEAGLGASEGDAAEVQDLISELPEGELPTRESRNVVSRAARGLVDFVAGEGEGARAFDSDAERAAAEKRSRLMNQLKSKLLGAARSDAEIADFNEGYANLRTKADLEQFAADWQRKINRREAGVKAGFRPEVVETFEERQRSRQPTRRPDGLRSE